MASYRDDIRQTLAGRYTSILISRHPQVNRSKFSINSEIFAHSYPMAYCPISKCSVITGLRSTSNCLLK